VVDAAKLNISIYDNGKLEQISFNKLVDLKDYLLFKEESGFFVIKQYEESNGRSKDEGDFSTR
jgi:hypothetical protein